MPGGAAKKGAVGFVALLGLTSARFLDDCGKLGARGASVADDFAEVGVRGRGLADDGLGSARGLAGDAQDALGPGRYVLDGHSVNANLSSEEALELAVESAVEVGAEILAYDAPAQPARAVPSQVRCPARKDLLLEPDAWRKYLGGLGIACAPFTFVSRSEGDTLLVDGVYAPVEDLAKTCAAAGGACLFVGCEGDGRCFKEAMRAALMAPRTSTVAERERAIARKVLDSTDASWVAFDAAPGRLAIVRAEE